MVRAETRRVRRRFSDPEAANALMDALAALLERCGLDNPAEEEACRLVSELAGLVELDAF